MKKQGLSEGTSTLLRLVGRLTRIVGGVFVVLGVIMIALPSYAWKRLCLVLPAVTWLPLFGICLST